MQPFMFWYPSRKQWTKIHKMEDGFYESYMDPLTGYWKMYMTPIPLCTVEYYRNAYEIWEHNPNPESVK